MVLAADLAEEGFGDLCQEVPGPRAKCMGGIGEPGGGAGAVALPVSDLSADEEAEHVGQEFLAAELTCLWWWTVFLYFLRSFCAAATIKGATRFEPGEGPTSESAGGCSAGKEGLLVLITEVGPRMDFL